MLVLTRKNRESIVIGGNGDERGVLVITVLQIDGGRVRLGFEGDAATPIFRREVWDRMERGDTIALNGGVRIVDGHVAPLGTSRTVRAASSEAMFVSAAADGQG
jgi:carbon storage regulator CsrA